eukprot:scaffold204009_cov17-Prasinocladus_malaysianus.AAC.1
MEGIENPIGYMRSGGGPLQDKAAQISDNGCIPASCEDALTTAFRIISTKKMLLSFCQPF